MILYGSVLQYSRWCWPAGRQMRTGDRRWRSFTKTSWPSAAMRWKPSTLPTGISSWHLSREERKYFWVIQSGPGSGKWSRCTHTLLDNQTLGVIQPQLGMLVTSRGYPVIPQRLQIWGNCGNQRETWSRCKGDHHSDQLIWIGRSSVWIPALAKGFFCSGNILLRSTALE